VSEIDLDAVLAIVAEQAKAVAILSGQLAALRKHADKQAKELADLCSKQECASS
jgi:uncharacterized coiled-coil protein SlyX